MPLALSQDISHIGTVETPIEISVASSIVFDRQSVGLLGVGIIETVRYEERDVRHGIRNIQEKRFIALGMPFYIGQ